MASPNGEPDTGPSPKPPLTIILAAPRGFCAGVDRAIEIVELALQKFGAPVYVRHEIVHNKFVVESLRSKGAIFVEELDEIPETGAPVVFSAHGVPKSVPAAARLRNLLAIDATCPLVSKVHIEAQRWYEQGYDVLLIGHSGHPEVTGTMGQLPEGAITLVEDVAAAWTVAPRYPSRIAVVTQTTLSVADTAEIMAVLRSRFPVIATPAKEDICYATTNRQAAVTAIAPHVDQIIVVGAPNSSNSLRLVEVAAKAGCPRSALVQRATDIAIEDYAGAKSIGITAGASAPEVLVEEIIATFRKHFDVTIETVTTATETIAFNVPRILRDAN